MSSPPFQGSKKILQQNDKIDNGPLSLFSDVSYNEEIIRQRNESMKKIVSDTQILRKLSEDLSIIVAQQNPEIKKVSKEIKEIKENVKNATEEISKIDKEECCNCQIF